MSDSDTGSGRMNRSSVNQPRTDSQTDSSIGAVARILDDLPFGERVRLEPKTWKRLGLLTGLYVLVLIAMSTFLSTPTPKADRAIGVFIPTVVLLAFFFETMDSAAGMGFGTALSPLLLALGYEPLAVVPVLLISETVTGLLSGTMHNEFENVRFSFDYPLNDATKAVLLIAGVGIIATVFSIVLTYFAIQLPDGAISAYVAVLVFVMALVALFRERLTPAGDAEYQPSRLVGFAALAGFNKGIGGGGYGPVVTLGELYAGVYEKSAAAITSMAEGLVSIAGVITFFAIEAAGVGLDFTLLPSVIAGAFLAGVFAPYTVRVVPNRLYRYVIPVYALLIGIYSLSQLI